VIEAKVEVNEKEQEEAKTEEVISSRNQQDNGRAGEASGGVGESANVHIDSGFASWADLEPEERSKLYLEWSERGPAMPEGLSKEERVAWLDLNWPLDGGW
jgi:hypothetical protein